MEYFSANFAVNSDRTEKAISVDDNLIIYIWIEYSVKYLISNIIAKRPTTATSNAIIFTGTITSEAEFSLTSEYPFCEYGFLLLKIKSIRLLLTSVATINHHLFEIIKIYLIIYCNHNFFLDCTAN